MTTEVDAHGEQIRVVKIFSRHLEAITQRFPDVCDTIKKVTYAQVTSFIIDAEIVAVEYNPTANNSSSTSTSTSNNNSLEGLIKKEKMSEETSNLAMIPSQLDEWKILPFQKLSTRSRKEIKIEEVEVILRGIRKMIMPTLNLLLKGVSLCFCI